MKRITPRLDPVQVRNFVDERKRRKYPNALVFSILFAVRLLVALEEPSERAVHSPAVTVAAHLLTQDGMVDDFVVALEYRRRLETGFSYTDPAEEQGYMDFIALYIAASLASPAQGSPLMMESTLDQILQAHLLPEVVRVASQQFVVAHAAWALEAMPLRTLDDGRDMAYRLIDEVEHESTSPGYQRGLRTAQDTLLLYLDLEEAILHGELKSG